MPEFISLHNYTCYSIMRSINRPNSLIDEAAELGMKAVAITDYGTLAAIWDANKIDKGVKLIVGCTLNFTDDRQTVLDFNEGLLKDKPDIEPRKIVLIAKNAIGYKNLLCLNFEAEKCKRDKGSKIDKVPLIDWNLLEQHHEGLICLTGNAAGIVGRYLSDGEVDLARAEAVRFSKLFEDDFAFELQPNNMIFDGLEQFAVNRNLYKLSKELGVRCVAASNSYYTKKEQAEHQDFLTALKNHRSYKDRYRPRLDKPNFYLHTGEDIVTFFTRNYGQTFAEELCANSVYLADKCEQPQWVRPQFVTGEKVLLPEFPVKDQEDYAEFLAWVDSKPEVKALVQAEDKLYMRYACEQRFDMFPQDQFTIYEDRYKEEIEVFETLDFCSYMLITYDFLKWGRKRRIRIGPGRGSVGGSLVGYLLWIHRADPIKYGLIFARFLNIEKQEFPDIDNDFDSVGRIDILNYVTEKYSADCVAHVSNFVGFTPKNAITDVMTCLEVGGSRAEAFRIAKNITETIPDEANKSLHSAMEHSPLLKEFLEKYPKIKEFAEAIIGLPRSYGTHAAGLVISKYPLAGLVPLRMDDFGNVCLEYEKTRAEENGLIKIDFLGLETLNVVETTNKIIKELQLQEPQDPPDYDYYDKPVYDLISAGDTFGVFQYGASDGTIELCKKVEPISLEDCAAITALARPGVPQEVKMSYIERRFGRESIEIPHPNFEYAVRNTMGLPIFEECFLFIAHHFCGWNLQKSDKMRKISKLKAKGKHLLIELEEGFIKGAMAHSNVDEAFAKNIWDEWVIPLSGYAFNKSHSILYSMTSLHTAYLKTYYFAPFMTATLISETKSNSPKAKDKIIKLRHSLRKHEVKIMPPNVNLSDSLYKLTSPTQLITGFSALKGVKGPAAEEIVKKRPFKDFGDFLTKVDASKVHIPVVEALAAAGALDSFGITRKSMYLYAADLRKKLKAWEKKKKTDGKPFEYTLPEKEWSKGELRALEQLYLGEALTGTKESSFPTLFVNKGTTSIKDMDQLPDRFQVVVEIEIKDLFMFRVKKKESKIFNEECCRMLGEDLNGDQIPVVMFPQQLEAFKKSYGLVYGEKAKIEKGFGIRVSGSLSRFQSELSLITSEVYALMKPMQKPKDMERKTIEIYSGVSKKKLLKKTEIDIEDDLLSILGK